MAGVMRSRCGPGRREARGPGWGGGAAGSSGLGPGGARAAHVPQAPAFITPRESRAAWGSASAAGSGRARAVPAQTRGRASAPFLPGPRFCTNSPAGTGGLAPRHPGSRGGASGLGSPRGCLGVRGTSLREFVSPLGGPAGVGRGAPAGNRRLGPSCSCAGLERPKGCGEPPGPLRSGPPTPVPPDPGTRSGSGMGDVADTTN